VNKNTTDQAQRQPPRRQRRPGGGYPGGDQTQRRIIETALDVFGEAGFAQASTRAIARKAQVNLGALTYYFGNKAGLYRACALHIADAVEAQAKPAWERVAAALKNDALPRRELLGLLREIMDAASDDLVGEENPKSWLLFVAREFAQPTAAADILYERVTAPSLALLAALIGRATGRPADAPETVIRAITMMGQFILFRRMRPLALRALGWPDFADDRIALVRAVLWRQIEATLTQRGSR
jgi:AcrR family transcriptional regulator